MTVSGQSRASRGRRVPRPTGDDRERAILATFEGLLEERGLHAISIDDIARGAGISRPTFYFYFASKEAVLLSLFERMIEEARANQGDALERISDDPASGLRAAIAAHYETFRAHRSVTLAGADASATSPEVRAVWSGVMEGWVAETAAGIEAERARGAAPGGVPARELATALVSMNERVLYATFAGHPPAVGEDSVVDVLLTIWLNAIYGGAGAPMP